INLTTDTIIAPKSNSSQKNAFIISSGVGKIVYSDDEDNEGEVIYEQRASVISELKNPPLYILDGKEIKNEEISAIDSNSIAHIEVLKENSAIKQYGKKGENGVILITTKKNGDARRLLIDKEVD